MKVQLFSYNQLDTWIHELSGFTKLTCFIILSFATMLSYDWRILVLVTVLSCICLAMSKVPFKKVKPLFIYVFVFLILNFVLTYIFAPSYGCEIYGSNTELFRFNSVYTVTVEEIYYLLMKTLKRFSLVPLGMVFIFTTNPSEFASSLNHIGIPYKICTTLALTLRYFPEIISDYNNISLAQQARGIEMSKKEKTSKRVKEAVKLIIPLIFSTLDRVEFIANAMTLRGYGKEKKRTWYSFRKLATSDYLSLLVCVLILLLSLFMRFYITKGLFYYPLGV